MWFIRFKQIVAFLLFPWLLSVLIQSAGRVFLVVTTDLSIILTYYREELWRVFTTGLVFDIRSASIAYAILLVISLPVLFLPTVISKIWQTCLLWLSTLFTTIFLIFTLINIFFYDTYDRHIDVFIFGLIDDDTSAILQTVWYDYPIIWGTLAILLATYLIGKLYQKWQQFLLPKLKKTQSNFVAVPFLFLTLVITFIGCRGSVDVFPLRKSDAQVSRNKTLNMFVPNGLIAFDWAYKDYLVNNQFLDISDEMSQQLLDYFFMQPKPNSLEVFAGKTATNLTAEQKPPHVILSVMESLGTHLFLFDSPRNDLLGSLRPHWQQGWKFTRFISEGDGTIDTLNRFFVRSPVSKISQSSAQFTDFDSNMFKPFLAKGYKIVFITTGNGAWRNLNQFLPHLGVSEFVEQTTLIHEFPEASADAWGVPDEYMFKYAQRRLLEAEEQGDHLLIMMLSVTNHPPFHIPQSHDYINFTLNAAEQKRLSDFGPDEEVNDMLNTFRYSNDQLGDFIDWIKSEPLGEHTIMSFTGDHNMRGIGYPDPRERVLSHGVPFYLDIPEKYRVNAIYDPERIGSHKDVFPTLYQLALSETNYYQTGCNLLAKQPDPIWCGVGYNPYTTIDQNGAYFLQDNVFHPWQNQSELLLASPQPLTSNEEQTMLRWQSFSQLLYWQITKQIE
ncbi:LTA synthase family protein [Zophobihabitans entericus]|uniref:Sulfatase-like hydrolase/transferase n=1 Tax=Zophobihabitans entericus TaxID=1635327 RepID=A0A6G9ICP8_9GAMM|nr:LTA synthase family protein [Zophobihabitans entericus]QIQ22008.1 sulfatase-like hydrolase/transferase [Zophobihabitans entericus]